jgi:Tfp pilus assembly protein PilX
MHLIHRCQQGFTTVTLMGTLMVGGLLVAATFTAVQPDIAFTQKDADSKQAYGAAEAGLNYYLNRLGQDNSYYTKCDQVPAPTQNAVNLEWNGAGADPRRWQNIPNSTSQYTVELLAIQTAAVGTELCVPNTPTSMIDPKTGTFRIRATGRERTPAGATDKPPRRSIIATLRRKSFIDFLYFTDFETLDPYAYGSGTFDPTWAAANCMVYRAQRSGSCQDPDFISTDSIDGPFKTNDSISVCGTPAFGRDVNDAIELNGSSPGWVSGCGGSSPNFKGTVDYPAGQLPMPVSNSELEASADAGYVFDGETRIVLNGTTMTITNNGTTVTKSMPPSGVVYANSTSCNVGYSRQQTYSSTNFMNNPGCGNVWVSGTYNSDLTIGADNDIIVMDDLKSSSRSTTGTEAAPTATTTADRGASRSTPRSWRSTTPSSPTTGTAATRSGRSRSTARSHRSSAARSARTAAEPSRAATRRTTTTTERCATASRRTSSTRPRPPGASCARTSRSRRVSHQGSPGARPRAARGR